MEIKMWFFSLTVLVAVGCLWSGTLVQANEEPGQIVFEDTKSFAPVPFNHDTHKSARTGCGDCHDALFKKKAGSTDADNALTMKALRKGKYCGSCHDGKQAFSASKNCKQCHHK
jgi:c(7)-type cytochrome triheme protein